MVGVECTRGRRTVAGLALLVVLIPLPARAHGDVALADATVTLAAGESVRFEGDVHYHRLVGRITADTPVTVGLVDARTGRTVLAAGTAGDHSLNELIRCCREQVWAPHVLVVENVGRAPATVHVRAALVHDDLAVMVDRAESGVAESVVFFGVVWVAVLSRSLRRRRSESLRASLVMMAVLTGLVTVAAWYGAVRYGGFGAPAMVAALSDAPVLPMNPVVSRASFLLGIGILAWGWGGARWARVDPADRRGPWLATGAWLSAAVVATGLAVTVAYRGPGIPAALTTVFVLPMLAVMAGWDGSRPRAANRSG